MTTMHPVEPEELQAFLDNELAAERRTTVEQHVAVCVDCRRLLEDLRQVSATLQAWQVEPAPAHLKPPQFERAQYRVSPGTKRLRPSWRLVVAFGGVAAAVLLVVSISIPNLLQTRRSLPGHRVEEMPVTVAPPASAPAEGKARERFEAVQESGEADVVSPMAVKDEAGRMASAVATKSAAVRRMVAQEVSLSITVKDFAAAKQSLFAAVARASGFVAHASSAETPDRPRRADLTLRVPVTQLAAVLDAVRGLGRVTHEQQSGEEVTAQYIDLEARLQNARVTEQRLVRVLGERTGKVKDILEVEREIARVRGEIERMEAQRKHLENRVALATLRVALVEEFEAKLVPAPVGTRTRIRNAFVEGYENFVGTLLGLLLFLARNGLNLLFWGGLGWLGWRSVRSRVPALQRLWLHQ